MDDPEGFIFLDLFMRISYGLPRSTIIMVLENILWVFLIFVSASQASQLLYPMSFALRPSVTRRMTIRDCESPVVSSDFISGYLEDHGCQIRVFFDVSSRSHKVHDSQALVRRYPTNTS